MNVQILAAMLFALFVSARTHVTMTVLGTPVVIPVLWLIAAAMVLGLAITVLVLIRSGVRDGGWLRLRPVVMTSLTAALGLAPAALANSIGSQAQKPLAIVVVGAMLCTLFLTRYMMPVLYSFFPAPAGTPGGSVPKH